MASGTPDYYQTVRNTYGAAKKISNAVAAEAISTKEILTVSGKGVIYGGVCYLDPTATQKESYFRLLIDVQETTIWTFEDMMKFGIWQENSNSLYLLRYDEVNFIYVVGISRGLTFEESVTLQFTEAEGNTPTVAGHLVYAEI